MRLPTWAELSSVEEQLEVLEYPLDQSLFVVGPPGSGKTILAIQRAQMAAQTEQNTVSNISSVSIVAYNRMLRRLFELLKKDGSSPVDIRTMHSFVWRDYKGRTDEGPPKIPGQSFSHDWETMHAMLESSRNSRFSKSHLVVDEGQDLPRGFFQYASRFVAPVMTVFADEDQALEEKRTRLQDIKNAARLNDPVILSKNHRNTPEISSLAEHFHSGGLPVARVVRDPTGELPRLVQTQGLNPAVELVSNRFKNTNDCIGVIVDSNNAGRTIYDELRKILTSEQVKIYSNDQKNENEIDVLQPGVTVLNRQSVKGQEFDTVFIMELEKFIPCNADVQRRVMYMICTRARDNLYLVCDKPELLERVKAALPGPDLLDRT